MKFPIRIADEHELKLKLFKINQINVTKNESWNLHYHYINTHCQDFTHFENLNELFSYLRVLYIYIVLTNYKYV